MELLNDYFNLGDDASSGELTAAYEKLKNTFSDRVFLKGAEGETAARELMRLQDNYKSADIFLKNRDFKEGNAEISEMVKRAAKSGEADGIQAYLDVINDKNAYWHYIQSTVYYIKKLYFDALRHLRLALSMDGENAKYAKALFKLEEKILIANAEVFEEEE
ncbi:MAG: hypothetical protein LBP62_03680 [Clostridiales bacterium]|jgi:hypothetical protein|nr:hypothetical protein [Clostridiales bacterium]